MINLKADKQKAILFVNCNPSLRGTLPEKNDSCEQVEDDFEYEDTFPDIGDAEEPEYNVDDDE